MRWSAGPIQLDLVTSTESPVRVLALAPERCQASTMTHPGVPLVEVDCLGAGRAGNSAADQHRPYTVSQGLRYESHQATTGPTGDRLEIRQRDPARGVAVVSRIQHYAGTSVLRVEHDVMNVGDDELVLAYVSTLSLTGFAGLVEPPRSAATAGSAPLADAGAASGAPAPAQSAEPSRSVGLRHGLTLHEAYNAWCAEMRWQHRTAAEAGMVDNGEIGPDEGTATSRARHAVTGASSWSSGGRLPMGGISRTVPDVAWVWQIEHPGSWHWEAGDLRQDLYLLVSGPTDREHQWRQRLCPGQRFTTVPAAVAVVAGDLCEGLRELTAYRRLMRRKSQDTETLPIIFNDYMNCLMGEADEETLAPLIEAAGEIGCEYFVIDAGWYADERGWWDTVGEWEPSTVRFPGGLKATTRRIRDAGMIAGLWLEPEVVGVNSPLAQRLPDEAFFQRGGRRVAENGRFHLDYRCPATREHMDAVVDRLVTQYDVGYLKLDYNINLPGTDGAGTGDLPEAPGAGLLGHNRAYLSWLDAVLTRHPGLVLENCASGGMRMDYGMLARLSIQSTSDQRDPLRYAAIAAAAPGAVAPEQGAAWAYPQPEHSAEEASFCLVNALLGRVHLSGRLDQMSQPQRERVGAALAEYRDHRRLLAEGLPYWPLGLPRWYDPWLTLAIATRDDCLLAVWCRESTGGEVTLHLPWLGAGSPGAGWHVEPVFPSDLPTSLRWSPGQRTLRVGLAGGPSARLLRFRRRDDNHGDVISATG